MDFLRSHYVAPVRGMSTDGQEVWVRWYRTAPTAKPLGLWSAFTSSIWEPDTLDQGPGPQELHEPHYWRGVTYPAPPGTEYHGEPEWFLTGIPADELSPRPISELCGKPTIDPEGGLGISGTADMTGEVTNVSLIVEKTTISTLVGNIGVLPLGQGTAYRLASTGVVEIGGLGDGQNGRMIILDNVGDHLIRLPHQFVGVAAPARIIAMDETAARLYPRSNLWLQYDGTSERWRELSTVPYVSTKGDLLTHTLTTPARLPVSPTEGHVLRANPSADAGMEWGSPPLTKDWWYYPPGLTTSSGLDRWVVAGYGVGVLDHQSGVSDRVIYAMPLPRPRGGTITKLGINIGGVVGPGSMGRLGIYTSTQEPNFQPDQRVRDTGDFPLSSGAALTLTLTTPYTVSPNSLIWCALLLSSGAPMTGIPGVVLDQKGYPVLGFAAVGGNLPGFGYRVGSQSSLDKWVFADGLPSTWPALGPGPPSSGILEGGSPLSVPAIYVLFSD